MKPMSNYVFRRLVLLADIDPKTFCSHDHLVSAVQRQVIRKKYGSTPNTTASERREVENKRQYWKRKLDMEQSIVIRNITPKKAL